VDVAPTPFNPPSRINRVTSRGAINTTGRQFPPAILWLNMPAVTAVELGPDTCVLVRAALRGADVRVVDVEILDPAAFPGSDAFVASLQQSRRKMNLPRRARVVLWGLPDGATPRDPAVRSLVAPLAAASFAFSGSCLPAMHFQRSRASARHGRTARSGGWQSTGRESPS